MGREQSRPRRDVLDHAACLPRVNSSPVTCAKPEGRNGHFQKWRPTKSVPRPRAVFENPRHDYLKRIVYELSAEGGLSALIGFAKGGSPRRFEFKREGS